MKNIHILPTDKLSRLYEDVDNDLQLGYDFTIRQGMLQNQNIYITSDEEIKEGDWCIITDIESVLYGQFEKHCGIHHRNDQWKKIILTTDQDLIKEGVQAIDDEFLEWFVKNPSCEKIYVNKIESFDFEMDKYVYDYKIIIPKEEPKQRLEKYSERFDNKDNELVEGIFNPDTWGKRLVEEPNYNMKQEIIAEMEKQETTLEEAAKGYSERHQDVSGNLGKYLVSAVFQDGAKWQQKQNKNLYNEEEVEDLIYKVCGTVARLQGITLNGNHIDTAYKQFKKK